MFIAYIDESGHRTAKVLTLGVCVATLKGWKRCERDWRRSLRMAGVSAFRMSQFESKIGEFTGMPSYKYNTLIRELAATMKQNVLFGASWSMSMQDYNDIILPALAPGDDPKRDPFFILLQGILESVVLCTPRRMLDKIACVFEQNEEVVGPLTNYYNSLVKQRGWAHIFQGLVFLPKGDATMLQAADLIAYEGYKHFLNQVAAPSGRPIRGLLASLFETERFIGCYLDKTALQRLLIESEHALRALIDAGLRRPDGSPR